MNLEIHKQLRAAMQLWGSCPDEKDEYGNTLLKGEVVDSLDVLSRMVERHDDRVRERAKRRDERIALAGTAKGREMMKLPKREELIKRLKKTPLASLAKELKTSRGTLRNRIAGGYVKAGVFVSFEKEKKGI